MPSKELTGIFSRYNVIAAYLFGSQVEGGADAMSDVDVGVVFGKRKLSLDDVLFFQDDLQRLLGPAPVDLVLLEKASIMVAYNAISQGELIYSTCEELRTDFEEHVLRVYHDFAPFLDKFHLEVKQALMEGDLLDK